MLKIFLESDTKHEGHIRSSCRWNKCGGNNRNWSDYFYHPGKSKRHPEGRILDAGFAKLRFCFGQARESPAEPPTENLRNLPILAASMPFILSLLIGIPFSMRPAPASALNQESGEERLLASPPVVFLCSRERRRRIAVPI